MRSTQYQKRILTGSISENVGLRDGSNLAKFHSFIIKVNNSAYFWTITAGLVSPSFFKPLHLLIRSYQVPVLLICPLALAKVSSIEIKLCLQISP